MPAQAVDTTSAELTVYLITFVVSVVLNCIPIFIASQRRHRQFTLITWLAIAGIFVWPLFFVALGLSLTGETHARRRPRRTGAKPSASRQAEALQEMGR